MRATRIVACVSECMPPQPFKSSDLQFVNEKYMHSKRTLRMVNACLNTLLIHEQHGITPAMIMHVYAISHTNFEGNKINP